MPDYANVLVKVVVILGVVNCVPAAITKHNVFCYSADAHILTSSINLAFRPKSGFRARAGFGLVIAASGRVQASNWGPFATLCEYVDRSQQGEIERIHLPPTNSQNRLKSFCEVSYANFRPNVFVAGKRISMEILVGVGLHAWCPVALKGLYLFQKTEMCKRNIYRVCNVKRLEQDIKSRCNPHSL